MYNKMNIRMRNMGEYTLSGWNVISMVPLLFLFFSCTQPKTEEVGERAFSSEYQKDLLNLHKLKTYKAYKNSFVLGLETISNRPQSIPDNGRKTILDAKGTGSLRHIWETHGPGRGPFELEFFVDGEEEPCIKGNFTDLIDAAKLCQQNFTANPGDTIAKGSYNFYLPVPFTKSLRVDLVVKPRIGMVFLQLDYRLEDESLNGVRLVQKTNEAGKIELSYESDKELEAPKVIMPKTETCTFRFNGNKKIRINDMGIIRRLAVNAAREGVTMRMRFDGETTPAVDVELADFFGPFRGVVFNNNQCYFPMPFNKSVEIEISGASPLEEWLIDVDIEHVEKFEEDWGYFHAKHTSVEKSVGYLPFQVLSTSGKGNWVGMSIYDTHHDHGGGDFTVIDANTLQPSFLHGINGEDYFSFAFFGKGENFPYSEAFDNDEGRMRVHFENPYPFEESIEINWGVTENLSPRSVAYWYQDTPKDLTCTQKEAQGMEWSVYGPATVQLLMEDGNTPDVSDLDKLFAVLPDEKALDAGKLAEAQHIVFNKVLRANFTGWAKQYASGPYLNLMYAYGHVMSELGGKHHMGYYARAMLAKTTFKSAKKQKVTLQLSFDDPLQLFLNDKMIYSNAGLVDGFSTQTIETKLKEGENKLLIKILDTPNNNTMWAAFSLRILDSKGNELKGLNIDM